MLIIKALSIVYTSFQIDIVTLSIEKAMLMNGKRHKKEIFIDPNAI